MKYRAMLDAFDRYFELLKNGFVVFGERLVSKVVESVAKPDSLRIMLEKLQEELSGLSG